MRRVIKGRAYNTDTATPLYRLKLRSKLRKHTQTLYQTRRGDFFEVIEKVSKRTGKTYVHQIKPVGDRRLAAKWITLADRGPGALEPIFPQSLRQLLLLEGEKRESTIYLRVPETLKHQLEAHAKRDGKSLNAWLMRRLEQVALAEERKQVAKQEETPSADVATDTKNGGETAA